MIGVAALWVVIWMLCCAGPSGVGWMDDMPYRHIALPGQENDFSFFCCEGPYIQGMEDALTAAWNHYLAVNGRLANTLMFFYGLLPPVVGPLLQGVMYALMMAAILRLGLGRGWRRHYLAAAGLVALGWVVLPWGDMMGSADFLLNYVWSSALVLWSLVVCRGFSTRLGWLWMVIPAALMHESISAAADAGLGLFILLNIREYRRRPKALVLPLAFMVASLGVLFAPGFLIRAGQIDGQMVDYGWFISYKLGVREWPLWVLTALSVLYGVKRRTVRKLIPAWGIIAGAFAISVYALAYERSLWIADCVGLAMLVWICSRIRVGRILKGVLAVAVMLAVSVWMGAICVLQWGLSRERDVVMSALRESPYPVMCADITEYTQIPWWMLDIPASVGEGTTGIRANISAEVLGLNTGRFAVLPPLEGQSRYTASTDPEAILKSIESLPELDPGVRGNLYVIVSRHRLPEYMEMTFAPSPEGERPLPGVAPIYRLRKYTAPYTLRNWADRTAVPTALLGAGYPQRLGTDTLYFYRPIAPARSLQSLRLTRVAPVKW